MDCPKCGHEIAPGSRSCGHCGEVLRICWHCGHDMPYDHKVCTHCGEVLWTPLLESAVGYLFLFVFLVLLLGPATEPLIRSIVSDRAPWIASVALVVGVGGAISLVYVVCQASKGWNIRSGFSECDAAPPRHDCPDWTVQGPASCVQVGHCRACGREVSRQVHERWSEWAYDGEGSCMQARTCLRCGHQATRGPDHVWKSTGIEESIEEAYAYGSIPYRYEAFECWRCHATKQVNLPLH